MDREMQNLLRSGLTSTPEEEAEIAEMIASGVMERLALLDGPLAGLFAGAFDEGASGAGELAGAADDLMAMLPSGPIAGAPGDAAWGAAQAEDAATVAPEADMALAALLRGALGGEDLAAERLAGEALADGVLGALVLPALPEVGEALRAAQIPAPDVSEAVMSGLPDDRLGALLRGALVDAADLSGAADAVMSGLPDDRLGVLLRRGLAPLTGEAARAAAEAVAEDVMDGLPRPARPRPALRLLYGGAHRQRAARAPQAAPEPEAAPAPSTGWRSWRPMIPVVAAMAALFLLVLRIVVPAEEIPADPAAFALGATNAAEVEDVEAWAASVQVMQFEENGVTFILIDEGEPSTQTVPL